MLTVAKSSGSFLITPNVGLMVWTLLLFGLSLLILWKYAFPRIGEALDRDDVRVAGPLDRVQLDHREHAALQPAQRIGGGHERVGPAPVTQ